MTSDRIQQLQQGIAEKWEAVRWNYPTWPTLIRYNEHLHLEGLVEKMVERWPRRAVIFGTDETCTFYLDYQFKEYVQVGYGDTDYERLLDALSQVLEAEKKLEEVVIDYVFIVNIHTPSDLGEYATPIVWA